MDIVEQQFYDAVESSPVIAAVKKMGDLEYCCGLEEI